jgi:hypothetical protein
VSADDAVRRPGVQEVGLLAEVRTRLDVVIPRGHGEVVVALVQSGRDRRCDPRATGDRANEPPSQKSFCMSTTITAFAMAAP